MDASTLRDDDVVYYAAVSADGFIAPADADPGWLEPYLIAELGFHDFIARVGGVIMGRRTFDRIEAFGRWPYQDKPGTVLSHRPVKDLGADVGWVDGAAADALAAAANRGPGPYWIVGGADVATQFLATGTLTRIDLFVIPVLLGAGVPAFRNAAAVNLEVIDTEPYANSVVRLSYRPRAGG